MEDRKKVLVIWVQLSTEDSSVTSELRLFERRPLTPTIVPPPTAEHDNHVSKLFKKHFEC
jgi:hypothetical protein